MIRTIIIYALWIYLYGILFPRALLSWFPAAPGSTLASINTVLYRLTEPVLAPVRRLLPTMQGGGFGIDLSFIIVFIGLQVVVIPLAYRL